MMNKNLTPLKGNEPMGIRGKRGVVTAKVNGKWYDSVTLTVTRRGATVVEAVDLSKPLTAAQIKDMKII